MAYCLLNLAGISPTLCIPQLTEKCPQQHRIVHDPLSLSYTFSTDRYLSADIPFIQFGVDLHDINSLPPGQKIAPGATRGMPPFTLLTHFWPWLILTR